MKSNDSGYSHLRLFLPGDLLFYLLLAGITYLLVTSLSAANSNNHIAVVEIAGKERYRVNLQHPASIQLDEFTPPVEIQVQNGAIAITKNDCRHHICMKMGPISRPGQTIVCVPKKILIYIPVHESTNHSVQAITG